MSHTPLTQSGNRLQADAPQQALAGDANPQKNRTGLKRIWHATLYSLQGLRAAWQEKAFRQEACLAVVLVPAACWFGQSWVEVFILIATVCLVLVAELLNSAVEATVDRVGLEWHALSKKAKDFGSAAVFIALLLCAGAWITAAYSYFF